MNASRLVGLAVYGLMALSFACTGDDAGSPSTPSATSPAPLSPPRVVPSPVLTPPLSPPLSDARPLVEVTGLFTEPRDLPTTVARSLGERPPSQFEPWDGASTIVYEVTDGTEVNLGPGIAGQFSPDGTRMVWVASTDDSTGEAILLDLRTMKRESLGPARLAFWGDNNRVSLVHTGFGETRSTVIDLKAGTQTEMAGIPFYPNSDASETPDGYELRHEYRSEYPFALSGFMLINPATKELLLSFEAHEAVAAGPGWLAVATEVQFSGPVLIHGLQDGLVNIFLVNIESGEASFIATSEWAQPNWPLAASQRHVVWTDGY